MDPISPLALALNDVVVDAESLLAACVSRHIVTGARARCAHAHAHAHSDRSNRARNIACVIEDLRRDMGAVAAKQSNALESCQFSLYALLDAATLVCSGLAVDDPLRSQATACRRKAQATLFTVQWLLARGTQHARA